MATPTRTPSRFVRLAHVCKAHPWRTFFAWLIALFLIQGIAAGIGTKKVSSSRLPGPESHRPYDLLAAHFPAAKGDTDQLVFRARGGSLKDQRARINAALAKVRAENAVAGVDSPFSPRGQISKDGRIGVATLNYDKSTNDITPATLEKVEKAAFTARTGELQVEHGGPGAEIVRFENTSGPSEGIGVLAAAVVLLITFGSAVAGGLAVLGSPLGRRWG